MKRKSRRSSSCWPAGGGRLEPLTHSRPSRPCPSRGPPADRLPALATAPTPGSTTSGCSAVQPACPSATTSRTAAVDLDRTSGGLLLLHPREGNDGRTGFQQGTADALWRNARLIREFAPTRWSCSAPTPSTSSTTARSSRSTASGKGGDDGDHGGRPRRRRAATASCRSTAVGHAIRLQARRAASNLITNEVFVFTPVRAARLLDEIAEEARRGLEDLGHELLPRSSTTARPASTASAATGATSAPSTRTARRTGSCSRTTPPIDLDDPSCPIITQATVAPRLRARTCGRRGGAALLAPGRTVAGSWSLRDRLWRAVEEGAIVRDSVLFPGALCARAPRSSGPSSTTASRSAARSGRRGRRRDRPGRPEGHRRGGRPGPWPLPPGRRSRRGSGTAAG